MLTEHLFNFAVKSLSCSNYIAICEAISKPLFQIYEILARLNGSRPCGFLFNVNFFEDKFFTVRCCNITDGLHASLSIQFNLIQFHLYHNLITTTIPSRRFML